VDFNSGRLFTTAAKQEERAKTRGANDSRILEFFLKTIAEERPSNHIEVNIRGLTKPQFSQWLVEIPSGGDFTNLCILTAFILRPGSLGPR
jgi:hypothetical protein